MMLQELWSAPGHDIAGPIAYNHMFVDMTNVEVAATEFTHAGHTCVGAMGYSFAAGTTDGELSCTRPAHCSDLCTAQLMHCNVAMKKRGEQDLELQTYTATTRMAH
jgi:hypothetical protein